MTDSRETMEELWHGRARSALGVRRRLPVVRRLPARAGSAGRPAWIGSPVDLVELREVADQTRADGLARTHDLLSDDEPRDLLFTVLSLRVLDPQRVELPVEKPTFRRCAHRACGWPDRATGPNPPGR